MSIEETRASKIYPPLENQYEQMAGPKSPLAQKGCPCAKKGQPLRNLL